MRLHLSLPLLLLSGLLSTFTALAQVVAPSQGGEVGLTSLTPTTMELNFGVAGNGQGRVITVAPAPGWKSVRIAAVDNISYSANTVFGRGAALGEGYVVYNGTGHSVVVTGLQPNTVYCIADAEYNTDGTTILYNIRSSSLRLSTPAAPQLAVATPTPLPVTLTSFTGIVDSRNFATLRWTTASEQNADYFALERSTDGATFIEGGRVAAGGSSSQPAAYTWADPQPLAYTTYYRLRQADHDGSARYSSVVTLAPRLARSVDVYPNPSAGQVVQVRLQGFDSEPLTLKLADALGRQVLNQTVTPSAASYQVPLPIGLATGTYFLTLSGNGTPLQKRLVVSE